MNIMTGKQIMRNLETQSTAQPVYPFFATTDSAAGTLVGVSQNPLDRTRTAVVRTFNGQQHHFGENQVREGVNGAIILGNQFEL